MIKTFLDSPAGQAVILAILAALGGFIAKALNAAAAHFNASANDKNETAAQRARDSILGHVSALAALVVANVEAAERPKLASVIAGGKPTAEDGKALAATALTQLKGFLTKDGLAEVESALGIAQGSDTDKFLAAAIEAANAAKPSTTAAAA